MSLNDLLSDAPVSVPLVRLQLPEFNRTHVRLDLLRLDLVHPLVSGNKWFKLKYALQDVLASDCHRVLSFGGAWSNHIHALAFAGYKLGIETIGVIRGERPVHLSAMLEEVQGWGMDLHFVSRSEYRGKSDSDFVSALHEKFGAFHLIPEGGSGDRVVAGCREILSLCNPEQYNLICCAAGTGGTVAGIIAAKPDGVRVLGVPVLKNGGFLYDDIRDLLYKADVKEPAGWDLSLEHHEGGYGKVTPELAGVMEYFHNSTGIELEPVYSGKAFLALHRMNRKGEFPAGSRILLIHTGGMQGLRGMREKLSRQLSRYKNGYNV